MVKLISQFLLIVASFFGLWLGLARVDWMELFHVRKASQKIEEKLGTVYWEFFKNMEREITDEKIINPIDSLLTRLCERNNIERGKIKLHLIDKDEVNAFTLPDNHLVVYSGLISDCENESELCGVLAHEIAHMEKGHIMKKLIKEVGLSVLISMTTGNGSPEIIQGAVKTLSSSAYDRNLEREADLTGVDYLIQADIDPEAFAHFMFRMAANEKDVPKQLLWISTHPDGEERTQNILNYIAGKEFKKGFVLDSAQWISLKETIHTKE